MRADGLVLIDTSIVVGGTRVPSPWTISAATLAELHQGVLGAPDAAARRSRLQRLARIEATVTPLPVDAEIARVWGELADVMRSQGRGHRGRAMDLLIAATARVHGLPLITADGDDFASLAAHVDVRTIATLN